MNKKAKNNKPPLRDFGNILEGRGTVSDILWVTRPWNPVYAFEKNCLKSTKDIISITLEILKNNPDFPTFDNGSLGETFMEIIKEMACDQNIGIIRWLAFLFSKIFCAITNGIFINELRLLKIKSEMGSNPVLLIPTHRSYADFIIMSYVCFHSDIDIPRIAAGKDFHSMAIVSNILRNSGAFFIRRSFAGDKTYASVFEQYVKRLITDGKSSVEFFIEGTRSRNNKSLVPKYGFLTVALKPYFTGLVPDITVLPINLNYERVMEDKLFVYELLGVPKPKESTYVGAALIKSFFMLSPNYGNIFVNIGEPLSIKEYLQNDIDRSVHNMGSVELQELTPIESEMIRKIGQNIVRQQQNLTIITCFNVMANVINHHIMLHSSKLDIDHLSNEVKWLAEILKGLGASLAIGDVMEDIEASLEIHKSLIIRSNNLIQLVRTHSVSQTIEEKTMKDHCLSRETLEITIPHLLIQYYSNPCAHFIVNISFILLVVESSKTTIIFKDQLLESFKFLRIIFRNEFVLYSDRDEEDFNFAYEFCKNQKAIDDSDVGIQLYENKKLHEFCINFLRRYISGYLILIDVLLKQAESFMTERGIGKVYLAAVELCMKKETGIRPACLSLDLVSNALQSFVQMRALIKLQREGNTYYKLLPEAMENLLNRLSEDNFLSVIDI